MKIGFGNAPQLTLTLKYPLIEAKLIQNASYRKSSKISQPRKRELEELPALIEKMEAEQVELSGKLWDPAVYQKEPDKIPKLKAELAALEARLKISYARWEELDAKMKGSLTAQSPELLV